MNENAAAQNFEFGSFVLRTEDGVLLKNGKVVPLTPKALQILLLLVRRHGQLVEKDEILREVWANTFVEESSVIRNISVLRKVFEEAGAENCYIETFHRRGYRFVAPLRATLAKSMSTEHHPPREIAVLPFALLNANNETEHLGLGLADTLTTQLSNFEQIIVRPTRAVLKYADAPDPIAVGQELKVEAVLSGSIQFFSDRLRVNLQLVSVEARRSIWGANLDSRLTDILEIQDQISEQIVRLLLPQLTEEKPPTQTTDSDAYQLYLRGRYHWNKRSPENLQKAIGYLQQAIEKDERYALAYAALADCYLLATGYDVAADFTLEHRRQKFEQARSMAQKALELDDRLGEAVATLAHVHFASDWDFEAAEKLYLRAIALKPNYPTARLWYGSFLNAFRRFDESLAELRRALALDVLSPMINRNLGATLSYAGCFDEAAAQYETTLEIEPNYVPAMYALGLLHAWAGRHDEASKLFHKARQIAPDNQLVLSGFGEIAAVAGRRDEALEILAKLQNRPDASRLSSISCYAVIYNYLGERDEAFRWIERAVEERDTGVLLLAAYPELRNLHDDPRFEQILRRIGLSK